MNTQVVTSQSRDIKATNNGSGEFYWGIDLEKTSLRHKSYIRNLKKLKVGDAAYSLDYSACGQAVYEAIIGEKAPRKMSAQTAAGLAVFGILNDTALKNQLRSCVEKSELTLTGFELNKKHNEIKVSKENSNSIR